MLSLNLINHLLQQNPSVCHELSGYNGLVLAVRAGSLHIVGRFNEHGLLDPTQRYPNASLILHPDAIGQIVQGKMPSFSDLAIEGDTALGMGILLRCSQLRYTPHADLRRLLGDEVAQKWLAQASKWGNVLQVVGQALLFQASQIGTQNTREQALQQELAACTEELRQLRQRIEQLERR
ncbi:hypothetical protein QG074_04435 [Kingella kingae]|uniref:hypothetical protein n=1 Tax=Kingella kingae TaxID=504 RepID=UPI002553A17F|nr:hypothetical protein [Kingella kingae]MDK4624517.1 hypothetical protein [Kingella kingae]